METQGSVGAKNQLTDEEIAQADVVIIAADTHVDTARFAGKPLYQTSVGSAVKQAGEVIGAALAAPAADGGSAGRRRSGAEAAGPKRKAPAPTSTC